jgi:hypothetical protein
MVCAEEEEEARSSDIRRSIRAPSNTEMRGSISSDRHGAGHLPLFKGKDLEVLPYLPKNEERQDPIGSCLV